MSPLLLKTHLRALVISALREKIARLEACVQRTQQEANEHGKVENMYDTFIEETHTLKAGYAMQINETQNILAQIQAIIPKTSSLIEPGSLVITDAGNFFVSTGLVEETLLVAKVSYDCVNINSPLIQRLQKLSAGDSFEMNGRKIKVLKIF